MTSKYLDDNLLYVITFKNSDSFYYTGKELNTILSRDKQFCRNIESIKFCKKQLDAEIQKIVNVYCAMLEDSEFYEDIWCELKLQLMAQGVITYDKKS